MVFAIRCPAAACRKYMLVEETDRGRVVQCLICKTPIKVPEVTPPPMQKPTLPAPAVVQAPNQ